MLLCINNNMKRSKKASKKNRNKIKSLFRCMNCPYTTDNLSNFKKHAVIGEEGAGCKGGVEERGYYTWKILSKNSKGEMDKGTDEIIKICNEKHILDETSVKLDKNKKANPTNVRFNVVKIGKNVNIDMKNSNLNSKNKYIVFNCDSGQQKIFLPEPFDRVPDLTKSENLINLITDLLNSDDTSNVMGKLIECIHCHPKNIKYHNMFYLSDDEFQVYTAGGLEKMSVVNMLTKVMISYRKQLKILKNWCNHENEELGDAIDKYAKEMDSNKNDKDWAKTINYVVDCFKNKNTMKSLNFSKAKIEYQCDETNEDWRKIKKHYKESLKSGNKKRKNNKKKNKEFKKEENKEILNIGSESDSDTESSEEYEFAPPKITKGPARSSEESDDSDYEKIKSYSFEDSNLKKNPSNSISDDSTEDEKVSKYHLKQCLKPEYYLDSGSCSNSDYDMSDYIIESHLTLEYYLDSVSCGDSDYDISDYTTERHLTLEYYLDSESCSENA